MASEGDQKPAPMHCPGPGAGGLRYQTGRLLAAFFFFSCALKIVSFFLCVVYQPPHISFEKQKKHHWDPDDSHRPRVLL